MSKTIPVLNEDAMKHLAAEIAGELQAGDVLLLKGDLGAGKTTFTKHLAASLGVEEVVASPTFTVIAEYEVKHNESIKELVHADLYRFEQVDRVTFLSLQEMWQDAHDNKRVVVIEWSERLGDKIPDSAWTLEFLHGDSEGERTVVINR